MVANETDKKIKELRDQIKKVEESNKKTTPGVKERTLRMLNIRLENYNLEMSSNLTGWQKVVISRHPERPTTLDYINHITRGFVELKGDRLAKDDKAIIGGFAKIDGRTVMIIGQQKGKTTKEKQYRNFGMPGPEGYRKSIRLMKLAEKFNKPIITLIDTPGASPGIEAEERGQAEAIGRNIGEMLKLKVPVISIIIGEGASAGALAMGVGDKVMMMEYTWYSAISPEACSAILWRNWDHKEEAADALKLTANDQFKFGFIDAVIKEPPGGAHIDPETAYSIIKQQIVNAIEELELIDPQKRVEYRLKKYLSIGIYEEI
jgi:acetyl-CoA carboxylase carboxyl transferase subunit alpha